MSRIIDMIGQKLGLLTESKQTKVQLKSNALGTNGEELFEGFTSSSTNNWSSGGVDKNTGAVITNKRRLVTGLFSIYQQKITFSFSQDGYKIEVYQYDADKNFVKMSVASNGTELTVNDNTRFVRFCLYRITNEKALSMGQWAAIFSGGLTVSVIPDTIVEPEPEPTPNPEPEPTLTPKEIVRREMIEMLKTGDMSVHDISQYNMDIYTIREDIWYSILDDDEYFYYVHALNGHTEISTTNLVNNICKNMYLMGMDEDYVNRYSRMMAVLEEIKSMVDPNMNKLDKLILAHDYIIEHSYYELSSLTCGRACGILAEGHGKCMGYADALLTVMHYINGPETIYVDNDDMNHAWNLVKIDNEYYNVDLTWDEGLENTNKQLYRNYFLASDARFSTEIPKAHEQAYYSDYRGHKIIVPATSTKFDNWWVHNVKGKMFYYNKKWYFAHSKKIKRGSATGTASSFKSEDANVKLISLDKSTGILTYKVNNTTTKTIKL